ncbi:protein NIM1-INTERACTING 1 [Mercurialis annua]|uniref:protein NIM1-INTERACTING 1 n=1 Tax=Mercurialis annua TaxID=3986 RepID=UPI00216013F4|nr:protein NIM1-INTERACTING 1 [Mercurialis annua]
MGNEKAKGNIRNADEDDEQEDQKVEKFFALIRNFQEARNRRKNEVEEEKRRHKKVKRVNKIEEQKPSWVPKFELEDFAQEFQFKRPPLIFPRSCIQKEENKEKVKKDELDLDLSL